MLTKRRLFVVAGFLAFALVAGATWAFAQEGSGIIHACVKQNGQLRIVTGSADCDNNESPLTWGSGGSGGGGSIFHWSGQAGLQNDSGFGTILLPSDGTVVALAIQPLENTVTKPARFTLLINGEETGLTVEVAAGSTTFVVDRTTVSVQAGDRLGVKSHAIYLPGEEIPVIPYPGTYPEPGGFPPVFFYMASVEYRTQ